MLWAPSAQGFGHLPPHYLHKAAGGTLYFRHPSGFILLRPVIDERLEISFRAHLTENEICILNALNLTG